MNHDPSGPWQRLLQELLLETNSAALEKKALQLEDALFVRGQQLDDSAAGEAERIALKEAARQLLMVRVEKLGFPLDRSLLGLESPSSKPQE